MKSLSHRAHTEPIFLDFKLLYINQFIKKNILSFMFKYIRGCLPPKLFNNYFIRNEDIHRHVTRQQNKLHTRRCRTSAAQKAFRCYGVILWNEFSSKVGFDVSLTCYKKKDKNISFESSIIHVVY